MRSAGSSAARIAILSHSIVVDDPRVRRQGDAFHEAGWQVVGIGLGGGRSAKPVWPVIEIDPVTRPRMASEATGPLPQASDEPPLARRISRWINLSRGLVEHRIGARPERLLAAMYTGLPALRAVAGEVSADLWLANDWPVLPIAAERAGTERAALVYDTHELATDEFGQSLKWRLTRGRLISEIEGTGLHQADLVTCVSDGIAHRLMEIYTLPTRPLVIRNVPDYVEVAASPPPGDRIRLLYHGIVAPGRGLEETIAAAARWRSEFHLSIRGPAPPAYLAALGRQIEANRVADRICFLPPVAMTDLVREAASFDVGFFALPGNTLQNVHVLPNKFFEYTMAGLALCVSDLPEMSRLLAHYDLGVLIADLQPDAIAAAVNSLDRPRIAHYKRNARSAAREFNWQHEGARLVESCASALRRGMGRHQLK